jgi:hypothetical protein
MKQQHEQEQCPQPPAGESLHLPRTTPSGTTRILEASTPEAANVVRCHSDGTHTCDGGHGKDCVMGLARISTIPRLEHGLIRHRTQPHTLNSHPPRSTHCTGARRRGVCRRSRTWCERRNRPSHSLECVDVAACISCTLWGCTVQAPEPRDTHTREQEAVAARTLGVGRALLARKVGRVRHGIVGRHRVANDHCCTLRRLHPRLRLCKAQVCDVVGRHALQDVLARVVACGWVFDSSVRAHSL